MQTFLPEAFLATGEGQRADEILRACVHCGFCNATCPTYRLLGDERDGPRGRIYLIKDMLEQQTVDPVSVTHLDRCLTCRACETTCPSGVAYGELLEIARDFQEEQAAADGARRSLLTRLKRAWLLRVVPWPATFRRWVWLGNRFRPLLGRRLSRLLPPLGTPAVEEDAELTPVAPVARVLLLEGCVQQVSTPEVNDALASLLRTLAVDVQRRSDLGCCGAMALHLGDAAGARETMSRLLDSLGDELDSVDAVLSSASGCGVALKDYGRLLQDDPERADRARLFADKVKDVGEFLDALEDCVLTGDGRRVALHVPCTLQHGQRQGSYPARVLERAGYQLVPVADQAICCGSAGTYSFLQPELSERLGAAKADALCRAEPDVIATANVGCQLHLAGFSDVPVVHWIELLRPGAGEVR